jgi:hypothetical protein
MDIKLVPQTIRRKNDGNNMFGVYKRAYELMDKIKTTGKTTFNLEEIHYITQYCALAEGYIDRTDVPNTLVAFNNPKYNNWHILTNTFYVFSYEGTYEELCKDCESGNFDDNSKFGIY